MSAIVARAPGKLFLLGEYAVLDGAPAVVAAVDRYVEVEVVPQAAPLLRFQSDQSSTILEIPAASGAWSAAEPCFFDFARTAYAAALDAHPELTGRGFDIRLSSAASRIAGTKLGFGSSAAITAALVAAFDAVATTGEAPADRTALFARALGAHRAAQRGVGSGADVAASVFGGVLSFEPQADGSPILAPLTMPSSARWLVGWTGTPASSIDLVGRYLALGNGSAALRGEFVAASTKAVEELVASCARGELPNAAIDAAAWSMEELASRTGLGVLTPALRRLIAVARAHGASAKVSGAGGGDCGIALVASPQDADSVTAAWRAAGLEPIDVVVGATGVSVERR